MDEDWLRALRRLRGRKALDAVVWLLDEQQYQNSREQHAQQQQARWLLEVRNKIMGWSAPIYLIDMRQTQRGWAEPQPLDVGVTFSPNNAIKHHIEQLNELVGYTSSLGMAQSIVHSQHSFWLQLAVDLRKKDLPRLTDWLLPLFDGQARLLLRGLFFVPFIDKRSVKGESTEPSAHPYLIGAYPHCFQVTPLWQRIITDSQQLPGNPIGLSWSQQAAWTVFAVTLLFAAGGVNSFFNNKQLITNAQQLAAASQEKDMDISQRLSQQQALQRQLAQLEYRATAGTPWRFRFGFDQNQAVLVALWPYYRQANERNLTQPLQQQLEQQLGRLAQMSPAHPRRGELTKTGYDQLKAYLMLSMPEKADAVLLRQVLTEAQLKPAHISDSDWRSPVAELLHFFSQQLARHPEWAINSNSGLIRDVRQVLLNQIGLKNAETTLYQTILKRTAQNYANLSLHHVLNGIDSRMLFISSGELPGIFTRQAWEGMVEKEIDTAASARREEIDWVLSDHGQQLNTDLSAEMLKQRLTERYFTDYSAAWLNFLNNLQWQPTNSISEAIDQLTVLADVRQSPLIALMNSLNYQGRVAQNKKGISENLVSSAKEWFGTEDKRRWQANSSMLNKALDSSYPLSATFGPVLKLLDNNEQTQNDHSLSLQTYLTRVMRVRLKLQQITNSPDPQAMARAMAKTVFQGRSVDLTDTRDYGSVVAASFGEEWNGFGHRLFVQPLEQAWKVVLAPAVLSFSSSWREQLVVPWQDAFSGRYPFEKTNSDASLSELNRFLRHDSGLIDRFVNSQLGGVLDKQGDQWVVNELNSQGLRVSQPFLDALNQLTRLSNQLFSHG